MLTRPSNPLPEFYVDTNGKKHRIRDRYPYILAGDLTITSTAVTRAFADGTFYHGSELPFEVTRAKPKIVTLDNSGLDQADPNKGGTGHLVQMQCKQLGKSQDLLPVATRIVVIVDDQTGFWDFDAPRYLGTKDGFHPVLITNNIPSGDAAGGIRFTLAFHGSLLVLE